MAAKIAGHALRETDRAEQYGTRAAALYTAACECGKWAVHFHDRLSVVRRLHKAHLNRVRTSPKEPA